jgi:PAS domain S-box-containing protein
MSQDQEQQLSARYAAMLAVAIDCIVMIDEAGKVLEFNPAAERTFGYRREDVVGKPMVDFIVPPDLRDAHRAGLARYLATGETRVLGKRIELRGHRANGDDFPVELTILRVEQPGAAIFAAYLRDLTEQARLERDRLLLLGVSDILAASLDHEETLRNLSHVLVPVLADWYAIDMLDARGELRRLEVSHRDPAKISLARELAERYPEDPDQAHGLYHVIRTGETELVTEISDAMLAGAACDEAHLGLLRRLGLRSAVIVPLRARARVVGAITLVTAESGRRYDERDRTLVQDLAHRVGEAIEKAMLFADVSESHERLAAEKAQAEESRRQADEANRAKSDFLASMSHELRTPLNAIMGYAQLLQVGVHGTLDPRQLEDLRRIDRSAQHLLGLINDILNFAKIEAGRLEFHLERIAVARVLSRAEELIAPQASAKALTYHFVNGCKDVFVCADEEKLIQIFVNLASNAVRYTKKGGRITIECRATDDRVITEVCDTGIGIPSDKLAAVFEPFVQVDRGYAGQRQGTGLGLAISRDLARGMGGDLTVRSEMGKGSVFSLELKRER